MASTALVVMWRDTDAAAVAMVSDGKGAEARRFKRRHGTENVRLVDIEEARRMLGNYIELKKKGLAP